MLGELHFICENWFYGFVSKLSFIISSILKIKTVEII